MISERFWHLVSRKLAKEALPSELRELDVLMQKDAELDSLYHSLEVNDFSSSQEESLEAEQAFALHSIRLHLSDTTDLSIKLSEPAGKQTEVTPLAESEPEETTELVRSSKRRTFLVPVFLLVFCISIVCGIYFVNNHTKNQVALNTVEVPVGQRVKITLPDKSIVWLNSKSRLVYPSSFSNNERRVTLVGEAFFDVVHNPEHPFVVVTPSHTINVLGTVFNVNAYPNSNNFETTLISGSVKVKEIGRSSLVAVLKPGESFTYNRKQTVSAISKVQPEKYTSWKEGLYQFNHLPLGEIMNRLSDYKGVTIAVKDSSILNTSYTGKFRQEESIDQIMQVLKSDLHFTYNYDHSSNTLTIQ